MPEETKDTSVPKAGKGALFRQGILFSVLVHQFIVLALSNFSEPIDPFVLRKDVQELENIEVYKPPSKTIQIPEVKPPAQMVQTAPEVSESEEAAETIDLPKTEYVPLETDGGDFESMGLLGGEEDTESDVSQEPQIIGSIPKPSYPEAARDAGWQGECRVGIYVSDTGEVLRVRVLNTSGRNDADQAALAAARTTSWEPAMKSGRPIAAEVAVTFEFKLNVAQ